MIYLKQEGASEVITTLYERCKNRIDPFFTWKITDKDSKEQWVFCSDDFSYAPYYWNAFTVSVSPIPGSATQGQINVPASTYTYEIFEMSTQYDLDLNNAVGMVESGILTINATFTPPLAYTQSNNDIIKVYRNQNRI